MIVSGPGLAKGQRVRAQVRTIDIMPTILDLLGAPAAGSVEGTSLRSLLEGGNDDAERLAYVESHYAKLHFGWAPLRGLRSDEVKFIDAPRRELYDLKSDPGEKKNLAAERADSVRQLLDRLERMQSAEPASDFRS